MNTIPAILIDQFSEEDTTLPAEEFLSVLLLLAIGDMDSAICIDPNRNTLDRFFEGTWYELETPPKEVTDSLCKQLMTIGGLHPEQSRGDVGRFCACLGHLGLVIRVSICTYEERSVVVATQCVVRPCGNVILLEIPQLEAAKVLARKVLQEYLKRTVTL